MLIYFKYHYTITVSPSVFTVCDFVAQTAGLILTTNFYSLYDEHSQLDCVLWSQPNGPTTNRERLHIHHIYFETQKVVVWPAVDQLIYIQGFFLSKLDLIQLQFFW